VVDRLRGCLTFEAPDALQKERSFLRRAGHVIPFLRKEAIGKNHHPSFFSIVKTRPALTPAQIGQNAGCTMAIHAECTTGVF
jgi:hypothetical protein